MASPDGSAAKPAARGTLRERPVPRLIQQVFRKRITGCLVITDDSGDVTRVYLREGLPVHADRPTDIDRLDRILASSGLVSPEVVAAADAEVTQTGRRLGEVLIRRGAITREALADVLKTQIRRKVTRLFFAREGSFEIYIQPHRYGDGDEFPLMKVDPRAFLYAGIRSAYDDDRLRNELLPLAGYLYRLVSSVPATVIPGMGIDPADPTLVAVRDRAMTLDDLPVPGTKATDSRALVLALLYSDLLDATVISSRAAAGIPSGTNDPLSAPVVTGHDRRTTWTAIPVVSAATLAAAQAGGTPTPVPRTSASAEYSSVRRPTPPPQSPADALRGAIIDLNQKLDTSSHFEILGVAENATPDEVNGMYMRALRLYHPDRLAAAGLRELAPQAERVMARMGEAASVLRDPKRRAEYVAARAGKKEDTPVSIVDAEKSFQMGEVFLRKGDYAKAVECFSDAIKVNPNEDQYRAYLAWARFDDPRARKDLVAREALATLQQVVGSQPKFSRGFFWMAQIWKYLNDPNQAEKAFREALRLDKTNVDAQREIRLLEMRKAKAVASKPAQTATARQSNGLFGKFLKRNE